MDKQNLKLVYHISKKITIQNISNEIAIFEDVWDALIPILKERHLKENQNLKLNSSFLFFSPSDIKLENRLVYTIIQCIDAGVRFVSINRHLPNRKEFLNMINQTIVKNHDIPEKMLNKLVSSVEQIFFAELSSSGFKESDINKKDKSKIKYSTKDINTKSIYKRDVFLSHASEDKEDYVIPLVKALERHGISYWLDSAELKWGDNITDKINQGIETSRFVIVFISNSFLNKNWPKAELNSALTLENMKNQKIVLPLLIGNDSTILEKYSIILPKLYLEWKIGVDKIVKNLLDLLQEYRNRT